jgi:hypothetical protein
MQREDGGVHACVRGLLMRQPMCGGTFSAGVRVPGNGPHDAPQSPPSLWCDICSIKRLQKEDSGGEGRL